MRRTARLLVEPLEDRFLLSGSDWLGQTIGLSFTAVQTALVADRLPDPQAVKLYRIDSADISAGDRIRVAVDTRPYGGALNSRVSVFREGPAQTIQQIASNDDLVGRDPGLTFQAFGADTVAYYIGVSSFDNADYDLPLLASTAGSSQGAFDLHVRKTAAAPASALIISSLEISRSDAVWGEELTVRYTLENRGAVDADPTTVELLLSADNRFGSAISLDSVGIGTLAAGEARAGTFVVTLGSADTPLASFADSQQVFLGLQVCAAVPSSPQAGNDWRGLFMLDLEDAVGAEPNDAAADALPVALDSRTTDLDLVEDDVDYFRIVLTEPGNVTARVDSAGDTALTLLHEVDHRWVPVVRSDGSVGAGPTIHHGLDGSPDNGGTVYLLKVANRGADTSFQLTTRFTTSSSRLQSIPLAASALTMATGDFDGDGNLDLVAASNVDTYFTPVHGATVLLGNGDGTFRVAATTPFGAVPEALVAADFDEDGRLDLVSANGGTDGVRFLRGVGDGTFEAFTIVPGGFGNDLAVGDFDGDGHLDLATAEAISGQVHVHFGDGLGSFTGPTVVAVENQPSAVAAGDFDGDGRDDLVVALELTNEVKAFVSQAGRTFVEGGTASVGQGPQAIVVGDFDGDGRRDLATVDFNSAGVTVLLGEGDGSFRFGSTADVGSRPRSISTGDFDGDGRLDLATGNSLSNNVSVLLGQGDGTFGRAAPVAVASQPFAVATGDFDGDGDVDLASLGYDSRTTSVLLGNGDGTFPHAGSPQTTGAAPYALASGDFNGDGHLDLATANYSSSDVTVLLGQGDGTVEVAGNFATATGPVGVATGDFNGDGRLDLATSNYYSGDVSVLLGSGDGSLLPARHILVGGKLAGLLARDLDADGDIDLAVALQLDDFYSPDSRVALLINDLDERGDGFKEPVFVTAGSGPVTVLAGEYFDDGVGNRAPDLAVGNGYSSDVVILSRDAHGDYAQVATFAVPASVVALTSGDFDGNGIQDFAVAISLSEVAVVLGVGNGSYQLDTIYDLGTSVRGIVSGDFDRDGDLDLATVNGYDAVYPYDAPADRVHVLLGNGAGQFVDQDPIAVGRLPNALTAGDFNEDGLLDLATADVGPSSVTTLVGLGTGEFVPAVLAPNPVQSTPLIAPLTGTAPDAIVLTQAGQILFRRGLAGEPGAFAPPVVLNPDPDRAARDLAIVRLSDGTLVLAALELGSTAVNGSTTRLPRVTLYVPHADGTFSLRAGPTLPAGFLPARLATGDLDGDGGDDLVISAAGADQVFVSLQSAGSFGPVTVHTVGLNPSEIVLVDVNGDAQLDIVVADRVSGQVSLLTNQGNGEFEPEERFRAGTGPYGLTTLRGATVVASLAGTTGVVTGAFDAAVGADLVVLNGGTKNFGFLSGDGSGFLDPVSGRTFATGSTPQAIVAGRFFASDPHLGLAILSKDDDTIAIYRGDGTGGFDFAFRIQAGNAPTGLRVADVSRPGGGGPDGLADLLVGNAYGDLLILTGTGNAAEPFSQYRRLDRTISLAVAASGSSGQNTFFFSNQADDRLAFRSAPSGAMNVAGATVYQDRAAGIQAPGPQLVVNVRGQQYLVVANSGANEILIYALGADGRPDLSRRQTYFAGTDPVSLVATTSRADDLNGDDVPDLVVVNQGSNDVSIFLGKITSSGWELDTRPRQSSGGRGPTSVVIADVTGRDGTGAADGTADLLVTNALSGQVSVLANRDRGFFINAVAPVTTFRTGTVPREIFVGNFDRTSGLDLVSVNAGVQGVTLIRNFLSAPVLTTFVTAAVQSTTLVGDFNVDGVLDLLVADTTDGSMQLLVGGPDGFAATNPFEHVALANLSDLALVVRGDDLDVYGTDGTREAAVLLASFGPSVTPPIVLPPGPGFPGGVEIDDGPDASTLTSFPTFPATGIVGLFLAMNVPLVNTAGFDEEDEADLDSFEMDDSAFALEGDEAEEGEATPTRRGAPNGTSSQGSDILLLNLESADKSEPEKDADPGALVLPDPGGMSEANPSDMTDLPISDAIWSTLGVELAGRRTPSMQPRISPTGEASLVHVPSFSEARRAAEPIVVFESDPAFPIATVEVPSREATEPVNAERIDWSILGSPTLAGVIWYACLALVSSRSMASRRARRGSWLSLGRAESLAWKEWRIPEATSPSPEQGWRRRFPPWLRRMLN